MVTKILIKPERKHPVILVEQFKFTPAGIAGNVPCLPLRQVLILPTEVLNEFRLGPGDLRENLVVDYPGLHDLPSGTVLRIGVGIIWLTFHCEPCRGIGDKVNTRAILHKRGYFGKFLNRGTIHLHDQIENLGTIFEPIPYALKDRLVGYLTRQATSVPLAQLLFECGLSPTYARAIPNVLKNLPEDVKRKVIFRSKR
jgi:MOSC domain-containing protein YiiM